MRSSFFDLAHVLVGKPVPTFPGHALSRRRVDPRRAVRPPLRYAVVELALLEHGVDEPDAGANQNSEEDEQGDIGDAAVTVAFDVIFFALRRFGLVHRSPYPAQRNE